MQLLQRFYPGQGETPKKPRSPIVKYFGKRTSQPKKTSFNKSLCQMKSIWCGNADKIPDPNKYSHIGSRSECMRKGFGAGMSIERKKHISPTSLQNIPYIGDKMEERFIDYGITTISELEELLSQLDSKDIIDFLSEVLIKRSRSKIIALNTKAYNSVLLYFYEKYNLGNLPSCIQDVPVKPKININLNPPPKSATKTKSPPKITKTPKPKSPPRSKSSPPKIAKTPKPKSPPKIATTSIMPQFYSQSFQPQSQSFQPQSQSFQPQSQSFQPRSYQSQSFRPQSFRPQSYKKV